MAKNLEIIAPVKGKGDFPAVESENVGVGEKRLNTVIEEINAAAQSTAAEVKTEKANIQTNSEAIEAIRSALSTAETAISEKAAQTEVDGIKTETADLQNQIDNIVHEATESGDVSLEVAQAHASSDGKNYPNLKARLDEEHSSLKETITTISSQTRNIVEGKLVNATINNTGYISASAAEAPYDMVYAPIVKDNVYTISTDEAQLICGYFSDIPQLRAVSYDSKRVVSANKTITAPITGYICFRVLSNYEYAQIEEGTKATDYIPTASAFDVVAREKANINENVIAKTAADLDERIHKSANLFDAKKYQKGYYNGQGVIIDQPTGFGVSDYVKVVYRDVVRFTQFDIFTTSLKGAMFDADKNFVGIVSTTTCPDLAISNGIVTFSIPQNVSYIRMHFVLASINDTMLTINTDYPDTYQAYGYTLNPDININTYDYLIQSFRKIGVVGDSLASGESISNESGTVTIHDLFDHSWLQYMARHYGFTGFNFSVGGMTTHSWLNNENGLAKARAEGNDCNCYIIGLGANDIEHVALGTVTDIGTNNDTFYGNYSKIITLLKSVRSKAKFFLLTLSNNYINRSESEEKAKAYNDAVRYIAENTENCYLIDLEYDDFMYSEIVTRNLRSGHYNAVAYNAMGMHLAKLIGNYMYDNYSEFSQVEFIDTDYSWN